MRVSSTRGVAARCGACWWSAVVGRRGARSECTCGTESAPAMANAYFGQRLLWPPPTLAEAALAEAAAQAVASHGTLLQAERHGRSSRVWGAAKCQGPRVPAPEGTGLATVASPRRHIDHARGQTYPCTLRLWCNGTQYVRRARGWYAYGARKVRGAPGASCPVPPVRTVRRRLARASRSTAEAVGRDINTARRQRCRGPSPAACQRAPTSAQRETGR